MDGRDFAVGNPKSGIGELFLLSFLGASRGIGIRVRLKVDNPLLEP